MGSKNKITKLFGSILIFLAFLILFTNISKRITFAKKNSEQMDIYFKTYNNLGNKVESESLNSYSMVLEIPAIDLKNGIYDINNSHNNIDENVSILSNSSYPDSLDSVVYLAAHSGSSPVSYFKNLFNLHLENMLYLYYSGQKYQYKITNIYTMNKTESLYEQKYSNNMLILITCLDNYNYLIIEAENI